MVLFNVDGMELYGGGELIPKEEFCLGVGRHAGVNRILSYRVIRNVVQLLVSVLLHPNRQVYVLFYVIPVLSVDLHPVDQIVFQLNCKVAVKVSRDFLDFVGIVHGVFVS